MGMIVLGEILLVIVTMLIIYSILNINDEE